MLLTLHFHKVLFLSYCSEGSVVVKSTIVFRDKDSVPSVSDATSKFSKELASSTSLNVIPGSVFARKLLV